MPKICLDPGHGGYDPGAVGNGLLEKILTLAICLELRPMLEANGITVVLTREGDYAPGHREHDLNGELQARIDIAENAHADIFVSVHINAGGGTGEEILVQHFGGNAKRLADIMIPLLTKVGGWYCRGVKEQNVMVLRKTSMPAILTESGFIDSVSNTTKLKDPSFIHALAVAHAQGLCAYFGITYTDGGPVTIVEAPPVHIPAPVQVEASAPVLNFSYANNAKVVGDDLYIRDANGNRLDGHYVSNGDDFTVLDAGYTNQLNRVEYPTPNGVRVGYVRNVPSLIKYYHQDEWQNGSTPETVFDIEGRRIGTIDPHEKATPIFRYSKMLHVVYGTDKGPNTKSGFVAWDGGFSKF